MGQLRAAVRAAGAGQELRGAIHPCQARGRLNLPPIKVEEEKGTLTPTLIKEEGRWIRLDKGNGRGRFRNRPLHFYVQALSFFEGGLEDEAGCDGVLGGDADGLVEGNLVIGGAARMLPVTSSPISARTWVSSIMPSRMGQVRSLAPAGGAARAASRDSTNTFERRIVSSSISLPWKFNPTELT